MKTFMYVSQAIRDTLILIVGLTCLALSGMVVWLCDEETLNQISRKEE